MAGDELRATLRGDNARLGLVRARDLARLIVGVESALAAAAYATLGRPRRGTTGRHRTAIEAACRLSFRGVTDGSLVTLLALPQLVPESDDTLEIGVDDLAGAAFDRLIASSHQSDEQVDPAIARALAELGEALGIGERHDCLLLASPRVAGEVRLDAAAKARMRRLADAPTEQQPDTLAGSLREADFDRRTARLHTPAGDTVAVTFPPELEDQIQDALRGQARFEGIVTYDAATTTARRVEVRRISKPEPLPFDSDAFWMDVPVSDLAVTQGVAPAALDGPLGEWSERERADLASALTDLDA